MGSDNYLRRDERKTWERVRDLETELNQTRQAISDLNDIINNQEETIKSLTVTLRILQKEAPCT